MRTPGVNRFLRSKAEEILFDDEGHGTSAYGFAPGYIDTMIMKCREANDDLALALWSRVKYRAHAHKFRFLQRGPGVATKR